MNLNLNFTKNDFILNFSCRKPNFKCRKPSFQCHKLNFLQNFQSKSFSSFPFLQQNIQLDHKIIILHMSLRPILSARVSPQSIMRHKKLNVESVRNAFMDNLVGEEVMVDRCSCFNVLTLEEKTLMLGRHLISLEKKIHRCAKRNQKSRKFQETP